VTQAYGKLKGLLKELFQFAREDLDFGIYRIMNHKRQEILKFLDQDLLPQVKEAFGEYVKGDESQKRERMAEIEEAAARFNADPENDEEYQQLKAELGEARSVSVQENEVYSDLYTFFRRYYKNGDFLSLRRYKPGVYAVPYEGEEVKLHWANADQYYVKTAENFQNYRFELKDVGYVNFDLVSAVTERDNNKPTGGKERRFVLREEDPVGETDGELHIYFEYRPHPDKQDALRDQATDAIFENAPGEWKTGLAEPKPTQSNKDRTLLEKHLDEYTARNTFDYFIHKDLGGFLRRELDFFLKSEVLHIDDLDTENERRVEQYLSKLKVIKRIGYKLIVFLAQIEDFQKKLFLKKKFVVSSGYCLTLDNVPEDLYAEIAANDAQYEEWERLFSISEIEANLENGGGDQRSIEWLKANEHLVLDTKFFDADFKDRLLAGIEDLDEKTDGLLVNSENFQALNLLQARYRERVKCIYIDPPYNTGSGDFIYKDSYQHSSWLSMMEHRLRLGREALADNGVIFVSIDDHEVDKLRLLMNKVFGGENFIAELVWEKGRKNDAKLFSVGHEYMLVYANSLATLREHGVVWREPKPGAQEIWEEYSRLHEKHGADHEAVQTALREWYRQLPNHHPSKALSRYKHVDEHGPWRDRDISWPGGGGPRYKVIHPVTKQECKIPERGWGIANAEAMQEQIRLGLMVFREDHTKPPIRKAHLRPIAAELSEDTEDPVENGERNSNGENSESAAVGMQVMPSVIYKQSQVAVKKLRHILGAKNFNNPKDYEVLSRLIGYCTSATTNDVVLDFFAGSGTTGHAVIDSNPTIKSAKTNRRRYLLAEMGEYFDSVLKPRILKVIYSKDWKDGRPVSRKGTSHVFKYMTLESYEDTLNNLSLRRTNVQDDLIESDPALREEYTLSYVLDFETKGSPSLLDLESFEDPFSYKLNITRDDETRPENVDLIETFNYLLGLTVSRAYSSDGYRVIEGTNPGGSGRLRSGATPARRATTTSTPSSRKGATLKQGSTASTPTGTTPWL
jgi:adenine-specific DNA-methyltransferase